ncbi:nitroreductase family deazaflavin-dependent oxidoreductase [Candidatus Chloroploca sp. Khr17]|uniref:nitroreductase family deazaflavin-dependent oxidoreductase n=1 Tax=Candidatus Chloroploca sp. Khr17 TaxID=2496869 RepID=UPI0013EDB495|nr:nitroreductase family deazaflavin-dependent oxidoreductase [Candidatus Chloroploca sp. Khr17]
MQNYPLIRMRECAVNFFGSPIGVEVIRNVIQPLDHLFYQASGGQILFLNFFVPTLMLTTTGARSGELRTVPLVYLRDGERIVLIASNYGSRKHPAWYHNLKANPACQVHIAGRTTTYRARQAEGEERDHLWKRAVALYAGYASYQNNTDGRVIPMMVLE